MSKAYRLLICASLSLSASLAACEKKSPKTDPGAVTPADRGSSGSAIVNTGPVDMTPLDGVVTDKLGDDKKALFFKLVGSLSSPCGKAESLRKAYADTSCKRSPFAARYVLALVEDDASEPQVREEYEKKYKPNPAVVSFDVSKAPHDGPDDAPVKMYEFFDYGCPHCKVFKPMLEEVVKDEAGKAVVYSMMFPLDKHEQSKGAAQAALAANAQGKFKAMHDMLFDKAPDQDKEHVFTYAKAIGLDMTKFENDWAGALPQVTSDVAQGDKAGVDSTPTLYLNNRKYEGPMHPKYIKMWIDEELAVNR